MGSVVISGGEAGLDADRAPPDAPSARDDTPTDDAGLGPVVAAMGELRTAIDAFLGTRARSGALPRPAAATPGLSGPGAATPVLLRKSTEAPPAGDDAGWAQAAAARGDDDPQRSWIEANAAMRRGDHAKAFQLFEREADRAADADDHPRAAVAYRMASDAATALGRRDSADYDLRRAGKQYLFVAESPSSSLQTMYRSYLTASRCFLAVGNLELTQSCVARALALQQTMNEDLHTRFNGPIQEPQ